MNNFTQLEYIKYMTVVVASLLLVLCTSSHAENYNDGLTAYKNKDYATAAKIWSSPELARNRAALFNLGRMHLRGSGVDKNIDKAIEFYKQAAELGYKSAQFNLGLAYNNGTGVEKDVGQAMTLWTQAAEQGHDNAQYNLAAILWKGKGVPQDQAAAMKWFRKSMSNGNLQASLFLYSLFEPMSREISDDDSLNRKQAGRTYTMLEELGLFKLGQQAVSAGSYDQAFDYWLPLAEDGHNESQYMIATLYESGQGVTRHVDTAVGWYEKAAKNGQADAQYRLGLYHINEASDPNHTLGLYWIQSAADRGLPTAIEYMANGG